MRLPGGSRAIALCIVICAVSATESGGALPAFTGPDIRVSPQEGSHSKPRAAVSGGLMWIVHVTSLHAGDFVALRSFDGEKLSPPARVSDRTGVEFQPVICPEERGGVWVAWAARRDGEWMVLARHVAAAGEMSREYVVGEGSECSWRPAVAPGGDGTVWVAWERFDGGQSRIVARRVGSGGPAEEVVICEGHARSHRPAVARDADGRVVFAWDSYVDGRYVLFARWMEKGWLGREFVLAMDGRSINADCRMLPDAEGRVWFTYSNGKYQLRWLAGETVFEPASGTGAQSRPYMALALDARGRPWFCGQRLSVWCWDDRGASRPVSARPPGPWNNAGERSDLCFFDGRLWVIWEEFAGNISMRPYPIPGSLGGPPRASPAQAKSRPEDAQPRPEYPPISYSGREHRVYFGDIHVHAEASEGSGYLDWAYSRARDIFRMDFLASADHDSCTPDLLSPSEWAEIQEWARRFDDPGRFSAFPGWEASSSGQRGRYGDRNVVCRDHRQPHVNSGLACANRPDRLYSVLDPERYLVQAGHHVSREFAPTDWDISTGPVVPYVEISSCHGVFEYEGNPRWPRDGLPGHSVQDGLGRGHRLGIISATDSHAPHSYRPTDMTAAIAAENTRAALWEAFRARRVYACRGGRFLLDFRVDGHIMGEEFFVEAPGPHRVTARAQSPDGRRLGKLEVVRNNDVVHTVEAEGPEASIDFTDDGRTGTATTFYYLRLTQEPGRRMAWSSPVWATALDVRPGRGRLLVPPGEKRPLEVRVLSPLRRASGVIEAGVSEGWSVSPSTVAFDCAPGRPFEAKLTVAAPARDTKERGELELIAETAGEKLAALRRTALYLDQWPEDGFEEPAAQIVAEPARVGANYLSAPGTVEEAATEHFIRNWAVLGPFGFDREGCTSVECREGVEFVPEGLVERSLAPALGEEVAGRRWVPYRAFNLGNKYGSAREYVCLDSGGMSVDIVENAVAYLAANVHSARESSDYQLLAGSDDYAKIWLNGELLLKYDDERRGASPDTDRRAGVRLRAGWNLLLVKLVNANSGWGMYVRLATGDGKAIVVGESAP